MPQVAAARLCDWLSFESDNTVRVFTGKVELGQGVLTAFQQMAAEELCLPFERIRMVPAHTDLSPNEGYTAGSRSVQIAGDALRRACAGALQRLRDEASSRFCVGDVEPTFDGAFIAAGVDTAVRYCDLATTIDWTAIVPLAGAIRLREPDRWIGRSVHRIDLPAKVRGAAFIHDLAFDTMLHGRAIRPPSRRARLVFLDETVLRSAPGVLAVVRDGSFVGVLAAREEHAVAAAALAARCSVWHDEHGATVDFRAESEAEASSGEVQRGDPFQSEPVMLRTQQQGTPPARRQDDRVVGAEYSRPFIAHASIGPSCALARFDVDASLKVWTHSQGIFQLRSDVARALGLRVEDISVEHVQGSGCYGHNGADDVAFDAVLMARAVPGRVVRVQWSRHDELAWSPVGSAMRTRVEARIDAQGNVLHWKLEVHSGSHMNRPGSAADGVRLLAAADLATPLALGSPIDATLELGGGGDRNALVEYGFPSQGVEYHFYPEMALRTSALRSLGAFANVFAIESFMDELAAAVSADPVEMRLRYLKDERSCTVLRAAQTMMRAGLERQTHRGRAIGCGYARYKNVAAYCAVFIELSVEAEVRLHRVWCAVDAGLVINPDGLVHQIEGGILQAASWTLKEQVTWEREQITSTDWDRYPILRFSEIPEVDVRVIDGAGHPALGVGEAAQGPTAGAIANAVAQALGIRPRDLPLTRERLVALIGQE